MTFPRYLIPNIEQFSDDPEGFWDVFVAANPPPPEVTGDATLIWLRQTFAKRYSHCFANILGPAHPYDAYALPVDIKAKIRAGMLAPDAP